ncbi:MAG: ABC transporter permease [Proteobacteria bacterium]|nr:ABC transporter permease [Desulfobacula sp.]MBU3954682.1 ABC transporter permease [Pseudomonadota bacterium]MBU4131318.1 ABC transporter permease [Pseudomonadota bacterium]
MKMEKRASEWRLLVEDPWLVSLVTWLPPLLFVMIYAIFSQGMARNLPVGVVDLDHSTLSRTLIRYYDASPTITLAQNYPDALAGIKAMRGGEIYGLLIIPADTEKNAVLGRPPSIEAFYNSQFLLIGKQVKTAILQAHETALAKIDTLKHLGAHAPVMGQALARAVPVGIQATPLFNSNTNYAQFLVSAVIPALWQIFIVMTTVLSMATELRRDGLAGWLKDRPVRALVEKLAPYGLLFWLHGLVFLLTMVFVLGWPLHGNLVFLIFCQLITVIACQCAGALIFFLFRDAARGVGFAAAYCAPGLAFMGVTFPATDMTFLARVWRSLMPISHYMDIQIAQVNYGAVPMLSLPQVGYLVLFILPGLAACILAVRISRTRFGAEVAV